MTSRLATSWRAGGFVILPLARQFCFPAGWIMSQGNTKDSRFCLDSALLQACWRLLLAGNPHWVAYPRRDGRQKQCAVGALTHAGTDYTNYAGLPYLFTPE